MKFFSIMCIAIFIVATILGFKDYLRAQQSGIFKNLYNENHSIQSFSTIAEQGKKMKEFDINVEDFSRKGLKQEDRKLTVTSDKNIEKWKKNLPPPPPPPSIQSAKIRSVKLSDFSRSAMEQVPYIPKMVEAEEIAITQDTVNNKVDSLKTKQY